jgi:hypothetical protein
MMVGDRMAVDSEFAPRVEESRFSRQEWGLIMTATTFEIENPEDEEAAELVADTDNLRGMMPELEKVADMGPMGTPQSDGSDSGGIFGSILDAFGLSDSGGSGGVDEEKLRDAKALVGEYADELQMRLESEGRWEEIRTTAAENEDE